MQGRLSDGRAIRVFGDTNGDRHARIASRKHNAAVVRSFLPTCSDGITAGKGTGGASARARARAGARLETRTKTCVTSRFRRNCTCLRVHRSLLAFGFDFMKQWSHGRCDRRRARRERDACMLYQLAMRLTFILVLAPCVVGWQSPVQVLECEWPPQADFC